MPQGIGLLFVALLAVVPASGHAQERLLGAAEVVKRLKPSEGIMPFIDLRPQIDLYRAQQSSLTPEESSRRWVELLHKLPRSGAQITGGATLSDVVRALPEVEVWPKIEGLLLANGEKSPPRDRLIAAMLRGDFVGQYRAVESLQSELSQVNGYLLGLIAKRTGDPKLIEKTRRFVDGEYVSPVLQVPDYVTLLGIDKARPELQEVLRKAKKPVSIASPRTFQLAQEIARKDLDRWTYPQWGLVNSPSDLDLYLRMRAKFPKIKRGAFAQAMKMAGVAYLIKGDAAKARSLGLPYSLRSESDSELIGAIVRAGHGPRLSQMFLEAVKAKPESPMVDTAIAFTLSTGDLPKLTTHLKEAVAKNNKDRILRKHLVSAYFADGRVAEGYRVLKGLKSGSKRERDLGGFAWGLIYAGTRQGHPEWVEFGLNLIKEGSGSYLTYYFDELLKAGQLARAEQAAIAELSGPAELEVAMAGTDTALILAKIYDQAGRYQDVRILMDAASIWRYGDVADAPTDGLVVFARALAKTGEPEKALELLRLALRRDLSNDDAYRLMVELQGEAAIPYFRLLATADAFQERPLIWEAHALLKASKAEEALPMVRRAISMDPSDGEQPHGRRMAAYGVAAEIFDALNRPSDAAEMRSVVKAIRMSEDADDALQGGLLKQALKGYSKSLKVFQDAYCIQSRLAAQYASQGQYAQAEVHFRKVFELMPDSFGRVESHCFGCEGAFSGEQLQALALSVFTRMEKEQPNKPQVPYLLGYLYSQTGDVKRAVGYLERAVSLDPDYLNAWKLLREQLRTADPRSKRIATADAALMRLDPLLLQTESGSDVDVKDRYVAVRKVLSQFPAIPKQIYPLKKKPAVDAHGPQYSFSFLYGPAFQVPGDEMGVVIREMLVDSYTFFFVLQPRY